MSLAITASSFKNNKTKTKIDLPKLNVSLDFDSPNNIHKDYEQYCVTKASLIEYNTQLQNLQLEKDILSGKISKIRICPTCGRPLEEI